MVEIQCHAPRKRNRSRLSLSDSIERSRLREIAKEKQRRHEDDSVNLGEKDVILIMVSKRRPLFMGIGAMKRVKNEKGSKYERKINILRSRNPPCK